MRFVVTGSHGQLGQCLLSAIDAQADDEVVAAFSREDLDVSDAAEVASIFSRVPGGADVLVNAAAFTAVDLCEREGERAFAVNGIGPGLLAEACREAGVRFVHVSTDYVFDGEGRAPYVEDHPISPQSAYGRSKAEGERRVLAELPDALVVRTSWVFGPGRNFIVAILEQAQKRRRGEVTGPLSVVDDQRGTPTYAADLAEGLLQLAHATGSRWPTDGTDDSVRCTRGVLHLTNAGETTWFDFAREILAATGHGDLVVEPISTADLDLPAPRPAYSVLDCSRAARLGVTLRSWRDALSDYLASSALASQLAQPLAEVSS